MSGTASLQAKQGGVAQPRTALSIIYRPHPSEAWSPSVLHRRGLHHEENVLFGGCHMQLRAPAHICAVPSAAHTHNALCTLTIDTTWPS